MESLDSIPEKFTRLRFTSDSVGKIKILYVSFHGILQARKEPLRVSMIEWEHYTTMAENFSVLTSPLCLDELSEASQRHSGRVNTEKFEAIVV